METREVARQIRLGVFVLGGVVLFLAAVFLIGSENNIFSRTFTISAVFRNVEGLKPGDNVWLSGVKVGTVADVKIAGDAQVVVDLALREAQNEYIFTDAVATIGSDGIVGSKVVVIRPGKSGEVIAERDTLATESATNTQDILDLASEVGQNTRVITDDIRRIAERINAGEGLVGELLYDGPAAREIRTMLSNLRSTGASTARTAAELQQLVTDLRSGPGLLPMLVSDTGYAQTFETALANIGKVSENAGKLSADLQALTTRINSADNVLGVLLADSTVAEQLRETVENAALASDKLDENMEALQHNFLFRGYFRRQERRERRDAREDREEREAGSSKSQGR